MTLIVSNLAGKFSDACKPSQENKGTYRTAFFVIDVLLTVTTLALGILGLCSVISLPPAATYFLLGVGGAIVLSYLTGFLVQLCKTSKPISQRFTPYTATPPYSTAPPHMSRTVSGWNGGVSGVLNPPPVSEVTT